MKHWQSNLCSYVDSLTAEEQCPMEGPKTTSHPFQGNRNAHKLVSGSDGSRTGVIVGTVVGCSAVVALIVAVTILVSMIVPAYDFARLGFTLNFGVQSTVVIFTYNS